MRINSVKWKNFMSYGNKEQELNFIETPVLGILSGNSGAGKSTIFQVIEFGLYGKVHNKKLSDLPNRLNQKLEVEIELVCNNKNIKIKRSLNPSDFKVEIDGNPNVSDKAGKKSVQDYLEELYKIPYYVFNNLISLSINDFKSFLRMSSKDKKDIIDRIFGLSLINQMYEFLRIEIRENKLADNNIRIKLDGIKTQIEKTQEHLKELNEKIKDNKQGRIEDIKNYIQKINSHKKKLGIKLDQYDAKEEELQELLNKVIKEKNKVSSILDSLNEKIELYNNSKCPVCGSDLDTPDHKSLYDGYIEKREEFNGSLLTMKSQINTIKKDIQESSEQKHEIKVKNRELEITYKNLLDEYQGLVVEEKPDVESNTLSKIISESKKTAKKYIEEKESIEKESTFLKIVEDILGDKGIKQVATKTIIPNLNIAINSLMKDLNLDYRLNFNEEFEAILTHYGQEINTMTLSTGEQKRLDFAVLIAILKLMKVKYPELNILFIDELFASIDSAVVYEIIKILDDVSKKLNLNIWVINHSPLDNSLFTHTIKIEKNKGFSNLIFEAVE